MEAGTAAARSAGALSRSVPRRAYWETDGTSACGAPDATAASARRTVPSWPYPSTNGRASPTEPGMFVFVVLCLCRSTLNMTREEKCAYQRGYTAGSRNSWPAHRPPLPPDPVLRRLIEAVTRIRDTADGMQAVFSPDDEVVVTLGRMIDEADAAAESVTRWLLGPIPDPPSGETP